MGYLERRRRRRTMRKIARLPEDTRHEVEVKMKRVACRILYSAALSTAEEIELRRTLGRLDALRDTLPPNGRRQLA